MVTVKRSDCAARTLASLATTMLAACLVACGATPAKHSVAADEAAIADFNRQYVGAINAGDLAYQRGTFTVAVTPKAGGETHNTSGNFLRIYRRQPDGSWRRVRDMFNSDRPVGPN